MSGRRRRVKRLREAGDYRVGSQLLADSDTQAIVSDLDTKGIARPKYAQKTDAETVKKSSEQVDLHDATDFDGIKSSEYLFSDVEYYHGWSEGDDVVLLRRDPASGKRIKETHPFEWYFFVRTSEAETVDPARWEWLCRHYAKRVEVDPKFPEWTRVYVERRYPKLDRKRIFDRIGDPDFGSSWSAPFYLGERPSALRFPVDRDRWSKLHEVLSWCQRRGVEPLEADLTPKQRFLTDYDMRIQAKYHIGFIDLETDDSAGGFDRKEQNRIFSIAWEGDKFEDDPSDDGFLLCAADTDAAEREMLLEFKRTALKKYDVIAAWNGSGFDFPVLFARFHYHGIFVDWRYHLFADPLPVFKRHYVRAGDDAVSYALDSIGEKVLSMKKVDWRDEFRARHPGVTPTFRNLWAYDPELLERYNRHDVRICRKLEAFTGFVAIEQIFCRIANGFANDWNISTKIDQLLLKKGFKEGDHFPTRFKTGKRPPQYEGAYVFPPTKGFHRNVAALDFKSLYPSMIRAFNISPETIVKEPDRVKYAEADLCRIPMVTLEQYDPPVVKGGTTFDRRREGYLSQMFVRTLERRKKYTDLQKKRVDEVGTTNDDLHLLYYRLAYSFKRLGLSFYGDLGNSRSRYYDTELAEAITLSGQFFIKLTARMAAEWEMTPLYGDTDSIYVQLAPNDETWPSEAERMCDLIARGERFVEHCQKEYRRILEECNCNLDWDSVLLEFEDVFDRIFFVTKKRYAGRLILHKGSKSDSVEVKGLEVMRSDCSGMTRRLQQAVLDAILMQDLDAAAIVKTLLEPEFRRCAEGELTLAEISIGKGISKDPEKYKTKSVHVKIAEKIKEEGREFYVGMKVVYVVTGTKPNLSGMLAADFDEDPEAAYDPEYYWDRVIFPATHRILETVFPEEDWGRWYVSETRRRRKLVERYTRWLGDRKNVAKAIERIRDNPKGTLRPEDLDELRRAPRAKRLAEGV